jgi:hypothetical protein
LPHAHFTVAVAYSGWMPDFMMDLERVFLRSNTI